MLEALGIAALVLGALSAIFLLGLVFRRITLAREERRREELEARLRPLALALVGDDDVELPELPPDELAFLAEVIGDSRGGRVARADRAVLRRHRGVPDGNPFPGRPARLAQGDRRLPARRYGVPRRGACSRRAPPRRRRRRPCRHGPQPRPARLRGGGAAARPGASTVGRGQSRRALDLGPAALPIGSTRGRRVGGGRADRLSATRGRALVPRRDPPRGRPGRRSRGWRRGSRLQGSTTVFVRRARLGSRDAADPSSRPRTVRAPAPPRRSRSTGLSAAEQRGPHLTRPRTPG